MKGLQVTGLMVEILECGPGRARLLRPLLQLLVNGGQCRAYSREYWSETKLNKQVVELPREHHLPEDSVGLPEAGFVFWGVPNGENSYRVELGRNCIENMQSLP